ncbi:MAG: hypothetical protein QF672_13615, partial [SAR202 cluster bacterium]|nr:hypothetical protein [SAR202 cluster bacterium]
LPGQSSTGIVAGIKHPSIDNFNSGVSIPSTILFYEYVGTDGFKPSRRAIHHEPRSDQAQ